MQPKRLSILGVGLLGGSIGLAVRSAINDCHITGYGHRRQTLQTAKAFGIIDRIAEDPTDAVRHSELIILCTPVGIFDEILRKLSPGLMPGAIVTDVGSTKRSVIRQAEQYLPPGAHFVGSHPIAGSEKRGVEFARTDLFHNALCITTPTPQTNPAALEAVETFWRSIGMRVTRMTPEEHDRRLAQVSHLPHAAAAALVAMQEDESLPIAGKGFMDATRIAAGDGGLWRDIFLDNRDNLRRSLLDFRGQIDELLTRLESEDADAIAAWLDNAAQRRAEWVNRRLRELGE